jgi:hypothetical protein
MLSDEYELLHTVSVNVVPVAKYVRILFYELLKLVSRHCGIPLTGISQTNLLSGLLKNVAFMLFVSEIAHTLCSDDALRPTSSHEFVEARDVHRTSSYIDVSSDAVFLSLTCFFVVMMVMMAAGALSTMMVFAVLIVLMLVMMLVMMVMMFTMFMIVIVVIVIIVVFFYFLYFFLLHFIKMFLYLSYPRCGSYGLVEVKHIGVENLGQFHVSVVTFNYLSFRL